MFRSALNPFRTPDARRLATLFAVVYFAQGMWGLPTQPMTIVLKERGLSSAAVADFMLISTLPWLIKPLYGLLSDFVPLFGRRRGSSAGPSARRGARSGTPRGAARSGW